MLFPRQQAGNTGALIGRRGDRGVGTTADANANPVTMATHGGQVDDARVCVLRLAGISCGVGGVRRGRRKSVMTGSAGNEHVEEPGGVLTR